MNSLLIKIKETLRQHGMIRKGEHVIAAVSGGPDSMAMLHLLYRLKDPLQFQLTVAHLHHGTRGTASDKDAEFVQKACEKLVCPVVIEKRDVPAETEQSKTSFQETARDIRLRFLEMVRQKLGADKVALGHTTDDQAETILMNLLRGSGPRGLGGMRPVRGTLIRPLYDCTRKEILAFLEQEKLSFREDASNQDTQYLRNRIRLELIPQLERDYNPDIQSNLRNMAEILQWEGGYLERKTEHWFQRLAGETVPDHHVLLNRDGLRGLHPALQARLVRLALERGRGHLRRVTFEHVLNVLKLVGQNKRGKIISLPDDWAAGLEADFLKIYKISKGGNGILNKDAPLMENGLPVELPGVTCIDSLGIRLEAAVETGPHADVSRTEAGQAFLDLDQTGTSLRIRFWRAGDRFQPLGMHGTKKVKDYLKDEKIPREPRLRTLVLTTAEGDIIWIVEGRISERFKVSPQTRNILNLKVLK